ncbi:MAG: hypothetical protein JXP37_05415 [Coriobacteriia bacterium]|nr:hypothetical protein [Coriobacteriia bacterium]
MSDHTDEADIERIRTYPDPDEVNAAITRDIECRHDTEAERDTRTDEELVMTVKVNGGSHLGTAAFVALTELSRRLSEREASVAELLCDLDDERTCVSTLAEELTIAEVALEIFAGENSACQPWCKSRGGCEQVAPGVDMWGPCVTNRVANVKAEALVVLAAREAALATNHVEIDTTVTSHLAAREAVKEETA